MASGSKKDASELFKARGPGWCGHGIKMRSNWLVNSHGKAQSKMDDDLGVPPWRAGKHQICYQLELITKSGGIPGSFPAYLDGHSVACRHCEYHEESESWNHVHLHPFTSIYWIYRTFVCLSKWLLHHFVNASGNVVWFYGSLNHLQVKLQLSARHLGQRR